ncbi:hypothetical protein FRC00_002409, partial [Tulasnella sp. 408]
MTDLMVQQAKKTGIDVSEDYRTISTKLEIESFENGNEFSEIFTRPGFEGLGASEMLG